MVTPTPERVETTGLPQPAEKWKRRRLEREAVARDGWWWCVSIRGKDRRRRRRRKVIGIMEKK